MGVVLIGYEGLFCWVIGFEKGGFCVLERVS